MIGKFARQMGLCGALALGALSSPAFAAVRLLPHIKVAAEERYDSEPVNQGAVNDPLLTKISPLVGGELKDPTLDGNAWYAADLLVHDVTGRVTVDHRAGIELKKLFNERSGVTADVKFWRVTDPTSLPRLGIARTTAPTLYGRADIDAHYLLTPRLTGKLGYRFEGVRILEQIGNIPVDTGLMHQPYVEALYAVTPRFDFGASYRFQAFIYGAESALAHAGLIEFRYKLSPVSEVFFKGGPIHFQQQAGVDGRPSISGWMPMATLELGRHGERFDIGLVAGHDLVGASGFNAALWADFVSAVAEYRFTPTVKLFGVGSYFRNGQVPNEGVNPFGADAALAASGYAAGVGVEWRFLRNFAVQGTYDRISQIGGVVGEQNLARNIAAVRLVWTAF